MIPVIIARSPSELAGTGQEVRRLISESGAVLIRELFTREEMRDHLNQIADALTEWDAPEPSVGASSSDVRRNFFKWSIGSHSDSQPGLARFMATFYNGLSNPDYLGMHSVFKRLIETRDSLAGRRSPLLDESLPGDGFNATRIQIYPRGGGFLAGHQDTTADAVSKGLGGSYLQPLLLVTEKGTDFTVGGAWIEHPDLGFLDLEVGANSGDLLVYDGSTYHGVADIDPHLPPALTPPMGRVAALATVYR